MNSIWYVCTFHMKVHGQYEQILCTVRIHSYAMQYSTWSIDLMYKIVHTVQYVQISCTTQQTLYSMYRSHIFTHQSGQGQEMVPVVVL